MDNDVFQEIISLAEDFFKTSKEENDWAIAKEIKSLKKFSSLKTRELQSAVRIGRGNFLRKVREKVRKEEYQRKMEKVRNEKWEFTFSTLKRDGKVPSPFFYKRKESKKGKEIEVAYRVSDAMIKKIVDILGRQKKRREISTNLGEIMAARKAATMAKK